MLVTVAEVEARVVLVMVGALVVSVGANVVDVTVGALVISVGAAVVGGCVVEVGA